MNPTLIEKANDSEMLLGWSDGSRYTLPYVEIRFHCPCAFCVDEHSGQRTLERSKVAADVRPTDVSLVGRYAIQIRWTDGHGTGIYPFERVYDLCVQTGRKVTDPSG